jgi:Flp pilus assembly protein TadG
MTGGPAVEWDMLAMRSLAKFFRRRARDISRLRVAQRGATAVEFALIAPAFLALLIAIFETTIFLFAQATLQNAAVQAGRLIMTGQVQNGNVTQSQFAADVCPMVQAIFTCSKLMIDVQNYSSFSGASTGAPTLTYNANGTVSNSWAYSPGKPGDVMVVKLIYQWPVVGGPLGFMLSNLANGTAQMMGITAFRIEPYF